MAAQLLLNEQHDDDIARRLVGVGLYGLPWTTDDTLWCICTPLGGILIILAMIIISFTVFHLWFHPIDRLHAVKQKTKILTSISLFFAFASMSVWWAGYFYCLYDWCGPNSLGHFSYLATMDTYVFQKLSLYLLIIYRLYYTYGKGVLKYPKWVFIVLLLFVLATLIGLIMLHPAVVLDVYNGNQYAIPGISTTMYAVTDILLTLITLFLFVRPLCLLMKATDGSVDKRSNEHFYRTIVRFITLSLITLISSICVGILMVVRYQLGFIHDGSEINGWDALVQTISFLNILVLCVIIDGFIQILCIALNFPFGQKYYRRFCRYCYKPIMDKYKIEHSETSKNTTTVTTAASTTRIDSDVKSMSSSTSNVSLPQPQASEIKPDLTVTQSIDKIEQAPSTNDAEMMMTQIVQ